MTRPARRHPRRSLSGRCRCGRAAGPAWQLVGRRPAGASGRCGRPSTAATGHRRAVVACSAAGRAACCSTPGPPALVRRAGAAPRWSRSVRGPGARPGPGRGRAPAPAAGTPRDHAQVRLGNTRHDHLLRRGPRSTIGARGACQREVGARASGLLDRCRSACRRYPGPSGPRTSGGQRSSPVTKRPTGWSSWTMTFCPAHPLTVPARPCR